VGGLVRVVLGGDREDVRAAVRQPPYREVVALAREVPDRGTVGDRLPGRVEPPVGGGVPVDDRRGRSWAIPPAGPGSGRPRG
jgi:hypothetical protein